MPGRPVGKQVYFKWWNFQIVDRLWKKWYKVFDRIQVGIIEAIESLEGPTTVESNNEPVEATYTAVLDRRLGGIPVTFTTDFLEADIDDVNKGDVSDLVGDGIEVETTDNGRASIKITFSNGVDKEEDITASIDADDEGVKESDTKSISVTVDTTEDEGGE